MSINFTIPGKPVAQGRPRFSTYGGFTRAYDPAPSRKYKEYVKGVAEAHRPTTLLSVELELTVIIYREIPSKFNKSQRLLAESGEIRPITKPDVDNFVKGISDALNGVLWNDDSQIIRLVAEKYYSENPRVEITVKELT